MEHCFIFLTYFHGLCLLFFQKNEKIGHDQYRAIIQLTLEVNEVFFISIFWVFSLFKIGISIESSIFKLSNKIPTICEVPILCENLSCTAVGKV